MKKKQPPTEIISGTLQQLLFSPKGLVEGFLMTVRGATVQISIEPDAFDAAPLSAVLGKRLQVAAKPDHSPKTAKGVHPVYTLVALEEVAGQPLPANGASRGARIEGTVQALHYARHGQPNGVMLESGEFVHLRPHGMERCAPRIGARVSVAGERRVTVLGNVLIEAHEFNGDTLE